MSLCCQSIRKHYGSVVALENASITVEEGEIRALLGGNGSGKSTLAKVVGGIITKNAGKVEINGKEVNFSSPLEAKKDGVVVASQELSLFNNLTVEENICACSLPRKLGLALDRKKMRSMTKDVLERLNLGHIIDTPMRDLPANQKYMVEFAKTLVQKPKVLILDEITSPLYKEDVQIVKRVMHELKDEGCIILFISHRMHELFDICDSVTVMKNGVTLSTYRINETSEYELLSQMTGIDEEELERRNRALSEAAEEVAEEDDERPVLLNIDKLKIKSFNTEVSFTVREGDFIGFAGLQGHGQSDLIRQLYGLSGRTSYEFRGKEFECTSSQKAVKNDMAFLSGDRTGEGIYPDRSIAENVKSVGNLVVKKPIKVATDVLNAFGVKYNGLPNLKITSLSGGNQQKVVVARWLATDPKLLLADDPTKGIDVQARYDLHRTFIDLANRGSGVLMVSSDDEELVELCSMTPHSRVIIMYEGNISKVLTGEDITVENIIAYSFNQSKGASA